MHQVWHLYWPVWTLDSENFGIKFMMRSRPNITVLAIAPERSLNLALGLMVRQAILLPGSNSKFEM
ncbi:MAG: hypothetical protein F6K09_06610 [Merismopedia sp. SIO2A8]|nr:hypothetical protein [Merismopedia sp. SIO2A8]